MAVKRIFKFALRIAVVVGIIAGVYFGISAINRNKNAYTRIVEAARETKIETKINSSYDDLVSIAQNNSLQKTMAVVCNKMTDALVQYYTHYVNLTCFENTSNSGDRDEIVTKIHALSKAIDETALRLENTMKITGNQTEKNKRFIKTLEAYFEQTKILIEVDELLKDYVYTVNYGVESTGYVYEAQLEMVKDYAKTVFEIAIYGKQEATSLSGKEALLTDVSTETGFRKVIQKFFDRSTLNTNSDKEVFFAQDYMTIDKQTLKCMYELTTSDEKQVYINAIEDETVKLNLTKVYNYMEQANY
ncbi:MAG: hypothetical protein J6T39_00020 [Clostridia bacterium]|nr:hypothetical protein [Clostridia bacterium]